MLHKAEAYIPFRIIQKHHGNGRHSIQQDKGCFINPSQFLIISKKWYNIFLALFFFAVFQQRNDNTFQTIPKPASMTVNDFVIRQDDTIQISFPQLEAICFIQYHIHILREFFPIFYIIMGNHIPQQICRLSADIPFSVEHQVIEEVHCHLLLPLIHICKVFRKNIQICPCILPIACTAGCFQNITKSQFPAQLMHQANIMVNGNIFERIHRFINIQQCRISLRNRLQCTAGQIYIDAKGFHIIFKVFQTGINVAIAIFFGCVHIIQLIQNHRKGRCQAVEAHDFFAFFIIAIVFHPEIGINQYQGFHSKIFQFQIPSGMVCGNMSDVRQFMDSAPKVCIIIMQVRNSSDFIFPASIFPDVMGSCGAGNQRQIHRNACLCKLSCNMHGNMMHPCYMSQHIKRHNFPANTHQFI